jgi:two-component system chemotaxis response regulator CheY
MTRVLVVDDSPLMRRHVAEVLTEAGFDVLEAADGLEALEVVAATWDLALIFLDLDMPRMNGLAFLEAMMQSSHLRPVKTVVLSTEARTFAMEKGKRAGAKGWLIKPAKPEHLVRVARRLTVSATLTETGTTFVVPVAP